jgi:hypothetical protein
MMEVLDLVDTYRELHPESNRYSWRGPHKKQARLDYFLTSSDFPAFITEADIDVLPRIINLKVSQSSWSSILKRASNKFSQSSHLYWSMTPFIHSFTMFIYSLSYSKELLNFHVPFPRLCSHKITVGTGK